MMTQVANREQRNITGILLLNKPLSMSSNAALQRVKHAFKARKAGHTGSLDPLATGMLPICLGSATSFAQYLLHADKEYQVCARLGANTTTGDAEGEVVQERVVPTLTKVQLEKIINQFRGTILQQPPMFSALKHKGQPLYKLARQGIEIARPLRSVTIYQLELSNFTSDEIKLRVHCSSGTYIRTLVTDIGEQLGCGAFVTQLHRTWVGTYQAQSMVDLETIQHHARLSDIPELDQLVLPIDSALTQWPAMIIEKKAITNLYHGRTVNIDSIPAVEKLRLYDDSKQFIGIGKVEPGRGLVGCCLLRGLLKV